MSRLTAANDFHGPLAPECERNIRDAFSSILRNLGIDTANDPNTRETAERYARMLLEVTSGRYTTKPKMTTFPNTRGVDDMYTVGPLDVRSLCSHHFVPIVGKCWIGIVPGTQLIGLSKFGRIVDWYCARPQIQEELTNQIADELTTLLQDARGVAVVVDAHHMCMSWRGAKQTQAVMRTNSMSGVFLTDAACRAEFLHGIR